jgi:carboxylate-amine ligase
MDAQAWRAQYEAGQDFTLGLEEELILLDPETLVPLPEAPRAVDELGGGGRFRTEMPASQIEQVTGVHGSLPDALEELWSGRQQMAAVLEGFARLAGAALHPCCGPDGPLVQNERYRPIIAEYGPVARYEQVYGFHVHVGVRGAERALAVYNALRSFLPEVSALAGNGPFVGGEDSGLASVRPKLAEMLPRQGTPPIIPSFEYIEELTRWGSPSGAVPDATQLWWEARLHPRHPTIEVRCPDQQTTVRESAAVAAFVLSLVAWLCERYDAGEPLPVHDTVRVAENRWRALRHGLAGTLLDLDTGEPLDARERVLSRLDELSGVATRVGAAEQLDWARDLAAQNGTERQRALAAEHGLPAVVRHLADSFLADPHG